MELQVFNLYSPHGMFFLATVNLWAKTEKEKTAIRLRDIISARYKKGVVVRAA